MQQKCDAWREEVEKLTPLRDDVAHLHQENARLQQEVVRVSEDNAGLGRQLQEMSSARRQVGEFERKAAEYDQLMDRVTELQHVRVELENELGPLRGEHAATLAENAALREGSQPEKYMQLKTNYSELSERCVKLQKTLSEETAISRKLEEANSVFQKQLQEATDEKGLQAIRDRMERYKQEREQLRMSVAQMQTQVLSHRKETQANQETISQLQQSLDEMAECGDQGQAGVWQQQIEVLSQRVEKYDKRALRYREERNTANILNASLQQQIETLQSTVQQLQSSRVYSSYESGQFDSVDTSSVTAMRKLQLQHNDPPQHRELSASPVEPYSPDAYSDTRSTHSTRSGMEPRKSAKRTSTGSTSSPHTGGVGKQLRSSSSSLGSTGIMAAHVTMRDGVAREVMIQKPLYKLNPKQIPKPEVIVKRKGGMYETGVLAYIGPLDGKEMAGVMLDLPSKLTSIITGEYEPPKWWQGVSNYVEKCLILRAFSAFCVRT